MYKRQTYIYSSGEKLYVDQSGTTAETIDNMKYSVLDTDKAGFGMDKDMTMGVELFKSCLLYTSRCV